MQVEDGNARPAKFLEPHPFGLVAGDMWLKSRPVKVNRNFRDVVLDSAVVKFSHRQ